MNNDLCYLSAVEAIEMFKSGTLSPVELLKVQIAQAERVEPHINAFSDTFFDQAMEQAKDAEARYGKGSPSGMLDGITVAIKDEVDVEGQRNTEGSLIHEHRIADEDAVLVARLREQGAIFHARTTCPEFCSLWNTHSRLHGVTRNPWNLDITPGGSSGGSGASLAAGTSTLATGSDIGGSIRFPASQCGLVGFKPPFGRIPDSYAPFNLESYCANGPMARTVADAALMQNVMSGPYSGDAVSQLPRVEIPLLFDQHLKGKKIAFTMDYGHLDIEPDVVRNTLEALDHLRALGAVVEEVELPWTNKIQAAYNGHMDALFYAHMAHYLKEHRELMCDYNVDMTEQAIERQEDLSAYYNATLLEGEMYAEFGALMEKYDVLVSPTIGSNKLRADFNPTHESYVVNGVTQEYDLGLSCCFIFNMMGRCPSMSVPSGLGENGVPTGLHIAAKAYDDIAVFEIAAALEGNVSLGSPPIDGF
jgi:Asp-tRNA(Asn)/Glu-tRNA(Gln) amidotransferase A subunit family amidase